MLGTREQVHSLLRSTDKKSIDFLLWKDIRSVQCFFHQALLLFLLSLTQLQCCDLASTGLRPWVNFALYKLTGHLFVTWQKLKKRKVYNAREKKINSLEYQEENSDRLADLHRLKAFWYKIACKLPRLECDTASVTYKQGGFLSFLSQSLEHTFFLVCFLCRICQAFELVPDFFLTFEDLIIHVL